MVHRQRARTQTQKKGKLQSNPIELQPHPVKKTLESNPEEHETELMRTSNKTQENCNRDEPRETKSNRR